MPILKNILRLLPTMGLLFLMTALSSCSDDEQESPSDVDIEVPTHDVVKTMVNAKAVVLSEVDGDLVGLFVKRLKNRSVTPVITDDTELVALDESSATSFLNNPQSFEVLKVFYIQTPGSQTHKVMSGRMSESDINVYVKNHDL